jgi:hypothetical protein
MIKNKCNINVKELDSLISKIEGGKSRVSIGNIREIRKIIDNLILQKPEVAKRYFKLAVKSLQKD